MKNLLPRRGFTLIEIMVVISIISILAAVLYANFSTARDSSRDRALQSEIKNVQLAIELYKAQTGQYPNIPGCGTALSDKYANTETSGSGACGTADYIDGLVPSFIAELPFADASANPDCVLEYRTDNARTWYKLTAIKCMSGSTVITPDNEMARCPATVSVPPLSICNSTHPEFSSSVAVYSAGGEDK